MFTKRYLTETQAPESADTLSQDSTESRAEFNETYSLINKVVEEMPPQRRQIFQMSRNMQLSHDEIAARLGLSVRTVEKHIQLALKDIRKNLS